MLAQRQRTPSRDLSRLVSSLLPLPVPIPIPALFLLLLLRIKADGREEENKYE